METPLERARAKCEELERELKRSPDFQLYLLTRSRSDQARMESVLMEIPKFALWFRLARSVKQARGQFDGGTARVDAQGIGEQRACELLVKQPVLDDVNSSTT